MFVHPGSPSLTVGELVAAAFDRAQFVTSDPKAAARLASGTVAQWLAGARRPDLASHLQRCARELESPPPERDRAVEARAA